METQFKAVFFEFYDTLVMPGKHSPRTETLAQVLSNLKENGIIVGCISPRRVTPSDYGFPQGSVKALFSNRGIDDALSRFIGTSKLHCQSVLLIGTSEDIAQAARRELCCLRFVGTKEEELEALLIREFGEDAVLGKTLSKEKLATALELANQPRKKAVVFDVLDTLLVHNHFVSETIVGTMQNLQAKGLELFIWSTDPDLTPELLGLPPGLARSICNPDKARGLMELTRYGVLPRDTFVVGDDHYIDGVAAQSTGCRFKLVNKWEPDSLERILAEEFGQDVVAKQEYGKTYKTIILDIDRQLLNNGTPEAQALVETLAYIRENHSDLLIVAASPERPGYAFLLGYPNGQFGAVKSRLVSALLVDAKLMGGTLEAKDILYLSSSEEPHKDNRNFCHFVNVGDGYEGIKKALETAFGTDIFEKASAQKPVADVKRDTQPGPTRVEKTVEAMKPELPKPRWFGARWTTTLLEKCRKKPETGIKNPAG